jgi:hypothetical protein
MDDINAIRKIAVFTKISYIGEQTKEDYYNCPQCNRFKERQWIYHIDTENDQ